ncbi:MAG: hypothetical protein CTY37_00220 [Methylotenera sp.]|nr:MAG: hypothetical protein CTY37_00220 [Methylotenera sp.]PPD19053.1 MAG: hypothetical protein CTY27_00065 [Methylotenera sp.]
MTNTELQTKFIQHIVYDGVSGTEAARRAGYSAASARQYSSTLLATPHIQAAIRDEQYKYLNGSLASKAIKTLEAIMDDETAPAGARVDCAKTLLDRAGIIAPKSIAMSPFSDIPIHEMTTPQLEALIEKTEAYLDEVKQNKSVDTVEGELA